MDLLKRLTELDVPAGREHVAHEFLKNEAEKLGYEVSIDALGSVIAHKKGNGKKLMLAAHIDEIGIIANYIDDDGFIHFGRLGWLYQEDLKNRRVRFANGTIGVIAADGEKYEEKKDISNMYIDIGAKNREEAEKLVKAGDTAVFDGTFVSAGDTIISNSLDDRIGCYLLFKAMEELKESKNDLYFVFTAQEETGMRGAKTSAFTVMPDYAIAVDVTTAFDTPGSEKSDTKLGSGAGINNKDAFVICDHGVINTLRSLAEENSIPYTDVVKSGGGNDGGAIALTGSGVKTGGIGIPLRYMHSASEMVRKSDIEASLKLLIEACKYEW